MTTKYPRAPKLSHGTCIATHSLIESAQRVFFFRSTDPVNWIDLSTLIEAIVIHDRIAFPMVHREYAEPLLKPLFDSGIADPWWPEAAVFNIEKSSKADLWASDSPGAEVRLLVTGWPDEQYEKLSDRGRVAIDGVAHGFGECALMSDNDELSILLFGQAARSSSGPRFDNAVKSAMEAGLTALKSLTSTERSFYAIPHESNRDIYNHYANHLRDLGNSANAQIVKSLVEEAWFDPVSVEQVARDTLYLTLKRDYEKKVVGSVSKGVSVVPSAPLTAIALKNTEKLNDLVLRAVELRDAFAGFRSLLSEYRSLHAHLSDAPTLRNALELERVETAFAEAIDAAMRRVRSDLSLTTRRVFNLLELLRRTAIAGEAKVPFEEITKQLLGISNDWVHMSYGNLFDVVRHFSTVTDLNTSSIRLVGKELDKDFTARIGRFRRQSLTIMD